MHLSELPALRDHRDELAQKIHKRRGGDYLAAVREANATCRGIYAKATGRRGSQSAVSESVSRAVVGARRGTVTTPGMARKAKAGKRRDAIVSEAVQRVVARVVAEAANGTRAPSRPLTEMDQDELAAQLMEATKAAAPAGTGTQPAAEPVSLPDEPLHGLDFESFEDLATVALGQGGQGFGSPFWAGANAVRSPFWRGL